MMGLVNIVMFFAILGGLSYLLYRYTKQVFATEDDIKDKGFIKSLLPQHNPLKRLISQSQNLKSPIYLTPDNLAVRILDFRRSEGAWHIFINVFNLGTNNSLIKIENIKIEWKNSEISQSPANELIKLSENSSFDLYTKFQTKERKMPKFITITLRDGYGQEFVIMSEHNNDNGEQVMS